MEARSEPACSASGNPPLGESDRRGRTVCGGAEAAARRARSGPERHPIGLVVTDDLRRSRLAVFFRLLLVIPHVSAWLLRYEVQTHGYIFLLTSWYPSLAGAPTV
jgi:hypothetical protein